VLTLLGIGLILLRHVRMDMNVPMLVMGTVVLMPGLGFILSAGVTWVLAGRLGLMPEWVRCDEAAVQPRVDPRDGSERVMPADGGNGSEKEKQGKAMGYASGNRYFRRQ
jgi:hypothetical protein